MARVITARVITARVTMAAAALAAALAVAVVAAAPAAADSPPLTVTATWTLGESASITGIDVPIEVTYTVSATSGTLYDVGFTDTFSSAGGVELYAPPSGTYSSCGTDPPDATTPTDNGVTGSDAVTLSGLTVVSGTACTVTFAVDGTTAGNATDSITGITFSPNSDGSDPDTTDGVATDAPALQVLENPTVALTVPKAKQVYSYGQVVKANYTCTETDYTNAVTGCYGFDDFGNEIDPGDDLDTLDAGKDTLTVYASNLGGALEQVPVSYTVKPFVVRDVKSRAKRPLSYSVKLPIAGRLVTDVLDGKDLVASLKTKVTKAGTVTPSLKLSKAGRRLLKASHSKKLKVKVRVSFTPSASAVAKSADFGNLSPGASTVTESGVTLK